MEKAFLNISHKFLQLNRICIDFGRFRRDLYAHEAYPSLKALTDVLSSLDIEHRALKIGWEQLTGHGTPVLLHYREQMPRFVVATTVTAEEIVFWKSEREKVRETREAFEKRWDGTALYVVEPERVAWKCVCREWFMSHRGMLWGLVSLLLLLSLFYGSSTTVSSWIGLLFGLKGIGLFFSVLLLRHDWGKRSAAERHICSLRKTFSCDAVLRSAASKLFGLIKMSDIGMVYFSGGLVCLLLVAYGVVEPHVIWGTLALGAFCSFPYILFSLGYQRLKVKKWCPLCLGVLTVLLSEIVVFLVSIIQHVFLFPSVFDFCVIVLFFVWWALAWLILNSWIKAAQQIEEKEIRFWALKRNGSVLRALLDRKPVVEMAFSQGDIVIGEVTDGVKVTLAINPFCTPCLDLYGKLRALQRKVSNVFSLNIRFMSMDEEALNKPIGLSLVSLYYQDKNRFEKAFDFWREHKDYDLFQKMFGTTDFPESARQELQKHIAWRKRIGLNHTPAVFIGDRKFPEIYTNEDLFYFLKFGVGDLYR